MSINILIIEDVNNKITALGNAVKEIINEEIDIYPKIAEMDVFIKKMSNAAKVSSSELKEWVNDALVNYLEDNDIDLIILDFYLYKKEEKNTQKIDSSSGYKILEEIRKSSIKNIPIFANSFKNHDLLATDDSYLSTLAGVIAKKADKDKYKSYFKKEIFLLNRMILLAEGYKKDKIKSDIVVICALKKEIIPVAGLLELKEDTSDTSKMLYTGDIEGKNNKKLKIVAVTKEQMGMAAASTLTTQMIEKYNPKFVVMTGIAAGIDDSQNFLDILMPAYIHNWQSGKFKTIEDKTKTEEILHIFDREYSSLNTYIDSETGINLEKDFLQNLPEDFLQMEDFKGDFNDDNINIFYQKIKAKVPKKRNEFQKELCSLFNEEQPHQLSEEELVLNFIEDFTGKLECTIHKGGMVSGSAVIADGKIVEEYIKARGIKGIDMEAYGVVFACNHHPSKPNVLILKAICDFADESKNDIYQTAAAFVSAKVFVEIFKNKIEIG